MMMSRTLAVFDNGMEIGCIKTHELMLAKDSTYEYNRDDYSTAIEYIMSHCPCNDAVTVELSELLAGNVYDAAKTAAAYRITIALSKRKLLRLLSDRTKERMFTFVKAKTIASVMHGRKIRTLQEFAAVCRRSAERMETGEFSSDDAIARIVEALPKPSLIRWEAKKRPEILGIITGAQKLAEGCNDLEIKEQLDDYAAQFQDLLKGQEHEDDREDQNI